MIHELVNDNAIVPIAMRDDVCQLFQTIGTRNHFSKHHLLSVIDRLTE